jgi:hypothetical protein
MSSHFTKQICFLCSSRLMSKNKSFPLFLNLFLCSCLLISQHNSVPLFLSSHSHNSVSFVLLFSSPTTPQSRLSGSSRCRSRDCGGRDARRRVRSFAQARRSRPNRLGRAQGDRNKNGGFKLHFKKHTETRHVSRSGIEDLIFNLSTFKSLRCLDVQVQATRRFVNKIAFFSIVFDCCFLKGAISCLRLATQCWWKTRLSICFGVVESMAQGSTCWDRWFVCLFDV